MAHSDWLDPNATAAAACPAPMTRAALLALRAAAALRPECPYIINDHVQNRLPAGTNIVLRAVGVNELSEQVEVNTSYDNESWAGIYDLDRALVLELTDNRGNVARGINGIEVGAFDWGNAAYTGCLVDGGTWTVTYGAAAAMFHVHVTDAATLNTTGFVGVLNDVKVYNAVSVNLTNANGTWRLCEWKNGGSFNASGYTGGGDNFYNEFDSCTINISGVTGAVTLRQNELQNNTITVAGANAFTITGSQLYSQTINRPAVGGSVNLANASSTAPGSINVTGAGSLISTGLQNGGGVSLAGTANLTVNYCALGQNCTITQNSAGVVSLTRNTLSAGAGIIADAGSTTTMTVNDCDLKATAAIRVIGAVGGGAFTVTTSTLESSGYIYKRHTGALSVTQSALQGSSGIDATAGDRSYAITRFSMTEISRANLSGTSAVTDSLNDIQFGYRGQLTISCSGAANNVSYGNIGGVSGSVQLVGTTGRQTLARFKARDGFISFNGTTVNVNALLLTAEDSGGINFNNITAAKTIQYITARNNGIVTFNNSTGAGTITTVEVTNAGQYVVSGAAGAATYVTAQQGTIAHNGGSLTRCEKRQVGTLTTGNFAHNGIIHASNVNTTLTAANTARALYMGLGPAAYAPGGILV